jgi:hypothetical protein
MSDRRAFLKVGLAALAVHATGCAGTDGRWVTLLDGKSMRGWNPIGAGNWSIANDSVQGVNGKAGYLLSDASYEDFELRVEFWADADCNSGVFIRCQDRKQVGSKNAYEVNIWDKRPDPRYGTGAIVNFAAIQTPMPLAANRWNVYEILAIGDRVVVHLNGRQTADMVNNAFRNGPIALQSAGGTIRFRNVQVKTL